MSTRRTRPARFAISRRTATPGQSRRAEPATDIRLFHKLPDEALEFPLCLDEIAERRIAASVLLVILPQQLLIHFLERQLQEFVAGRIVELFVNLLQVPLFGWNGEESERSSAARLLKNMCTNLIWRGRSCLIALSRSA